MILMQTRRSQNSWKFGIDISRKQMQTPWILQNYCGKKNPTQKNRICLQQNWRELIFPECPNGQNWKSTLKIWLMNPLRNPLWSHLKFTYSEKATKFFEIFSLLLSYLVPVKSKVKISQNFVAFSEYINFWGKYSNSHSCIENIIIAYVPHRLWR